MAVLLYHSFSFVALFSYGMYHLVSSTRSFFKPAASTSSSSRGASASGDHIARPYYPLHLPFNLQGIIRHLPIFFAITSLFISIAYHAFFSSAIPSRLSSLQTAASLIFFLLIAISLFLPLPVPPDLVFLLASVAFALLASVSSAYKPSDLQSKCDSISSAISAACAAFSLALAVCPRIFFAEIALAASVSLQGLWSLQTGLSLCVEAFVPEGCHHLLEVTDGSIRCELQDSRDRAAVLLDLIFALHIIFVSVISVAVYSVIAWGSGGSFQRRHNGGSYEALPTSSSPGGLVDFDHIQMKALAKSSMQA